MNNVFMWIGFITVTGLTAAIGVAAWWFVIDRMRKSLKETWWMGSWILYKRGDTERAKQLLEKAIWCDKANKESEAQHGN